MPASPTFSRIDRCLASLEGRTPDRVPTYMPAINCEVASAILGRSAYAGTGSLHYAEVNAWADGEAAHTQFVAQLEQDLLDLHQVLDLDVFHLPWRMNRRPTRRIDPYTFLFGDEGGVHQVYQYNPESADFAAIHVVEPPEPPEQRLREYVEKLEADEAAHLQAVKQNAATTIDAHRRFGETFFVANSGAGISVGIDETAMILLATEPELVARRCMLMAKAAVALGQAVCEAGCPPVLLGGGDLAGTNGMFYSPQMFRDVVLPAYRYAIERLNDIGVHYAFRSDGNIWSIADMLFDEARVPGFGEVDRDACMTTAELRRRYPNLVIWNNISSMFLVTATPQEVRDEAKRVIDESGGTRYFHGCSNAIIKGTPPENVLAMFDVRS